MICVDRLIRIELLITLFFISYNYQSITIKINDIRINYLNECVNGNAIVCFTSCHKICLHFCIRVNVRYSLYLCDLFLDKTKKTLLEVFQTRALFYIERRA